jgi:predicted transcriptional regulator
MRTEDPEGRDRVSHLHRLSRPKDETRRRRSDLEMRLDVLRAIAQGAEGPTRIMYIANLSWNTLDTIIVKLCHEEFISWKEESGHRRYRLTNQGSLLMRRYEHLLMLTEPLRVLENASAKHS